MSDGGSGPNLVDVELETKSIECVHVYLNCAMVVGTVLACIWIFLAHVRGHIRPFDESSQSSRPLVVLDFHSAGATMFRTGIFIRNIAKHALAQSGQMAVEVIVSKMSCPTNTTHFVCVDCNDDRNGEGGLVCRVERGYSHFLEAFPNCGWYFRAMDDTWVNPERLYDYVRQLSRVYDPFRHLVFIGHANHERLRNYYLHGGAGWLMSRAMIEYQRQQNLSLVPLLQHSRYQQDDTAQSIIVRHIFTATKYWDEMLISGFDYADNVWDNLPPCPLASVCGHLNQIFAQHTFGHSQIMRRLVSTIENASDDIMFYRDDPLQKIHLCKQTFATPQWKISYVKPPLITDKDVDAYTIASIRRWIDDMS